VISWLVAGAGIVFIVILSLFNCYSFVGRVVVIDIIINEFLEVGRVDN
jgi:hypothetical protein